MGWVWKFFFYLGSDELDASVLDVPAELGNGPANATEAVSLLNNVLQILLIVGGLIQPQRTPQQLVLIPTHRRVVVLHYPHASVIFPSELLPELEQLIHHHNNQFLNL